MSGTHKSAMWFLASIMTVEKREGAVLRGHLHHCLILSQSNDHAFERTTRIGRKLAAGESFLGVVDLVRIEDPPGNGSELTWSEIELLPSELATYIHTFSRTRARREGPSPSSWYLAGVVLAEVHDKGSHGDRLLVWVNSYLIRATSPKNAYARAVDIGRAEEDEPGSHKCGDEPAHWEFKGIEEIIPLHSKPEDGALLWSDIFIGTNDEACKLIPERSKLSVFTWEVEQRSRSAS